MVVPQGVKVDIPVLLNDTVGTLACARYGDGMHQTDTAMSLIVGTGALCGHKVVVLQA